MRRLALVLAVLAACGAPTSRSEETSATARLARQLAQDTGVPCPVYAPGTRVAYGGFELRFETPAMTEHALIVPAQVRNTSGTARSLPQGIALRTTAGQNVDGWIDGAKPWSQEHAHAVWGELGQLRAGEEAGVAHAFAVEPADVYGAVLYLARVGNIRDARGFSRRVVYEQAIVELLPAVPEAID